MPGAEVEATEAAVAQGRLRGETVRGVSVFRGVPFAAPPVGPRRLAPPAPTAAWEGVRPAVAFGPACPQGSGDAAPPRRGGAFGGLFGPGDLPTSEDCLYLNVWTPGVDDAARPVLVWLHGGAFRLGTGASPTYDGGALARRGDVVVVTLNYRLGVLGYLHAPGIGAVNVGLLDQVAALEWVRANIAGFGGDPGQVTVLGESAGAKSIECLLATPRAAGLFSRAIIQSTYSMPMAPDAAVAVTAKVLSDLGLRPSEESALREVPLDRLLAAGGGGGLLSGGGVGGPVVDGDVVAERPLDRVAAGRAPVPVIVGTTTDEWRLFAAMMPAAADLDDEGLAARVEAMLDPGAVDAARAIEIYRASLSARGEAGTPGEVVAAVSTDRVFRQHSLRLAEAQAAHAPVWMYLFGWKAAALGGRLGACHAVDVPFVFGNLGGGLAGLVGDDPAAPDLSVRVQDAWLAFARSGDPDHAGLPPWPRYDPDRRATMLFDRDCRVADAPFEAERRLWHTVPLP